MATVIEDQLRINQEQGNLVLCFSFGLDPADKTECKIIELKISSLKELIERLRLKLNRYMIKYKKKKRREIRKSGIENPDEESQIIDDTELKIYILNQNDEVVDEESTNEEAFIPGNSLNLQFGDAVHRFRIGSLKSPRVKVFKLPAYIMVGFLVYPRVDLKNATRKDSHFSWYRRVIRGCGGMVDESVSAANEGAAANSSVTPHTSEWELISEGSWCYTPTEADLGRQLRVTCTPGNKEELLGAEEECISPDVVLPSPGVCPFEKRHAFTKERASKGSFRLLTYNILADFYASKDTTLECWYHHAPPYALDLDYRKQLIVKEILGYNSDIICLQEVDQKVMDNDLHHLLADLGYEGHLRVKRRTSSQGVASFYRKDKFRCLEYFSRKVLDSLDDPEQAELKQNLEKNAEVAHHFTIVKSIMMVLVLQERESGRVLVVGNTHLFSRVKCPHIRLLQTAVYMNVLHKTVDTYKHDKAKDWDDVSLIVCGDFNSTPRSGVNVLLSTGSIPNNHVDWCGAQRSDLLTNMNVTQPYRLVSAYGYPEYTNYVPHFYGCIDYVYMERDKLECIQTVPLPSHEDVVKYSALPNQFFPSDHLALICDLKWKDDKESTSDS